MDPARNRCCIGSSLVCELFRLLIVVSHDECRYCVARGDVTQQGGILASITDCTSSTVHHIRRRPRTSVVYAWTTGPPLPSLFSVY